MFNQCGYLSACLVDSRLRFPNIIFPSIDIKVRLFLSPELLLKIWYFSIQLKTDELHIGCQQNIASLQQFIHEGALLWIDCIGFPDFCRNMISHFCPDIIDTYVYNSIFKNDSSGDVLAFPFFTENVLLYKIANPPSRLLSLTVWWSLKPASLMVLENVSFSLSNQVLVTQAIPICQL